MTELQKIREILQEELAPLKEEVGSLKVEVAPLKKEVALLSRSVDAVWKIVEPIPDQLRQIHSSMSFHSQRITDLEEQQRETNAKLERVITMETEDLTAMSETVVSHEKRLTKLEKVIATK
ncbi:hypothetical protein HYZ64_03370 [Candidatus Berkelbacteria bacterium]|nr:hypothetical protein [Candidatus Berkelbacteria bacterium]